MDEDFIDKNCVLNVFVCSISHFFSLSFTRLVMEQSKRHITGRIVHHTGTTVVSASTQEWAIKQHLYSTADVSAAHNIGRILADRCLKSGIAEVYTEMDRYEDTSEKVCQIIKTI